ncbi:MAG: molybdopterin molybdotransferase MoeA [Methylibium sp.]|uniref:molybdopterin molybdotransferase MoeA n=1 Tax=Methylibium sp. TaxID=2067992 RepID=UPI0017A0210A|nr:gephyrin-like molybdotransferase Glp [Methylibium sp.]MBA3597742.1 molybdopterin molybdotransferase MoeA [Methylibium sp.]
MPSLEAVASCIAGYDPDALTVSQAQDFITRFVPAVGAVEMLALRSALGRVLARDVISPIAVPASDNSAMDGYALASAALRTDAATVLRVAGTAYAGQQFEGQVAAGECVRIMTGAVMPAGLDTVVPQEFVLRTPEAKPQDETRTPSPPPRQAGESQSITIPPGIVAAGDNRRLAGEDLAFGEAALNAGRVLRPADIGLLASLGQAEVAVRRRLRVAFFSTGDELRSIGEPLDAGCVYDSNRYTLHAMLTRLGVEVLDFGVVRDEPAALEAAFRSACENADAVITSGGVSVGEADHTRKVMATLGEVAFWRIAMRPGRPMAFGRVSSNAHSAVLFGLPGNPVAVMVTFYAFVREALLAMAGAAPQAMPMLRARATAAIRKKPGRTEYQRGIVTRAADGDWDVQLTGAQGSGILRSMSMANGLVVLHHGQGSVAEGERVDVLPFDGLV